MTINHSTRRITASIQHVADIPLQEIAEFAVEGDVGTIGEVLEPVAE